MIITGGATGLTGSFSTINYSEINLVQSQAVTSQFSSFGATFNNFTWDAVDTFHGQAGSTGISGASLFGPNGSTSTVSFNAPVSAAVFAIVDQNTSITFNARLGGTLVESFSLTVGFNPGVGFVGFQGIVFDAIEIVHPGAMVIDTLQFRVAGVPDATSTLLLLGAGIACLGLARRKNS